MNKSLETTEKLSIYDFGKQLLETKDLDPVYVILWEAQLGMPLLKRWLLAYWNFYSVGTASWVAEAYDDSRYWTRMFEAAGSSAYPRSTERRHFRAAKARAAVEYQVARGVDKLFAPLLREPEASAETIIAKVMEWEQYGKWIAFKVADMLERLDLCKVKFSTNTIFSFFDSPEKGAKELWDEEHTNLPYPRNVGEWAVEQVLTHLGTPRTSDLREGRGLVYGREGLYRNRRTI